GPHSLVLRVSERYNALGPNGATPMRTDRIETLVSKVVGQPCTVRLETVRDESKAGAASTAATGPAPAALAERQTREKARQLPLVQKARDVLGAEILHVDPDFGEVAAPAKPADDEVSDLASEAMSDEAAD